MTSEDMKAAHRALIHAVLSADDPRAVEEQMIASHVLHQSVVEKLPPGRGGAVWAVELYRTSFGKSYVQIEDQIAAGDRCFTRITAQLQHTGRLGPARPTGRWVRLRALLISRFAGGKAVETWVETNDLDVLRQLDMLTVKPRPEPAPRSGEV